MKKKTIAAPLATATTTGQKYIIHTIAWCPTLYCSTLFHAALTHCIMCIRNKLEGRLDKKGKKGKGSLDGCLSD